MLPSSQRLRCVGTRCGSTWIFSLVWIVIITLFSVNTGSCDTECTTRDLLSLQKPCKTENDGLVRVIGTNHTQQLCSALSKLWICVAKHVPWCFDNMTTIYRPLTHSPHNCQISREDFRRIQELIVDSEKQEKTTLLVTEITSQLGSTTSKVDDLQDEDNGGGYIVNGNATLMDNGGSSLRYYNHRLYLLLIISVTLSWNLHPVL